MAPLESLLAAAERPVAILGGTRWSARRWRTSPRSPSGSPCRSPARSGGRCCSRPTIPPMPATSASVRTRNCWRCSRRRTSSCSSARGCRKSPRRATRFSASPRRGRRLVHVHADAGGARTASIGATFRSTPRPAPSRPRSPACGRRSRCAWAARTAAAHADYLRWSDPATVSSPGRLQMPEVMRILRERLPADAILTNGAGNYSELGAPLLAVPPLRHAARPDLRLDGLWHPVGGRREAASRPGASSSPSPATAAS